jgi:hypothetical protein
MIWGSNLGGVKRIFSLLQNVQTGSEAHPASNSMGNFFFIAGGKAARA